MPHTTTILLLFCALAATACGVADVTPDSGPPPPPPPVDSGSDAASGSDASQDAGSSGKDGSLSLGSMTTISVMNPPVANYQLVDQGFEFAPAACAGNLCVTGGIIP